MEDPITHRFKAFLANNYKYSIQEPLHEHREETALRFQSRNDYVDLSAYGVGKVKIDQKQNMSELSESEVSTISDGHKQNSILKQVAGLEQSCQNIVLSLHAMAQRHDDKLESIFRKKAPDVLQQQIDRNLISNSSMRVLF